MVGQVASTPAPAAPPPRPADRAALDLLEASRGSGGYDFAALSGGLARARVADAAGAGGLERAVQSRLTPVERGELARAADASGAGGGAATGPDLTKLGLDLAQMALDLVGIVDPTPITDGLGALLAGGRAIGAAVQGQWSDARGHAVSGGISVLGMAAVVGDAAKLAKIGKWAETVADAAAAIARNPAARAALEPALRQIRNAVNRLPDSVVDNLPAGGRAALDRMRTQLDELLGAAHSIGSRLSAAGLPTTGRIRFVPERGYNPANPLPRGPQNGFIDRFGNEWVKGPSRTAGQPFEWDVQLSRTGRSQLGWATRDGSHLNVSLDGRVTHR